MVDVGLEYMKQLGFKPARDYKNVLRNFQSNAGTVKADKMSKLLFDRGMRQDFGENIYDLKNVDLVTALTFNCNVDGDIIRKVCNWIYKHKDEFGNRILEVGCDIGILSCFIAQMFPDSHVTAVDRNASGIELAKQLAEKFNVKNITFLVQDINEVAGVYDTVFSCRTMHENYSCQENPYLMLEEYAALFEQSLNNYAASLSKALGKNGTLITIERTEKNPLFLGWLFALSNNGLSIVSSSYEELKCSEVNEQSLFQAFIANKDLNLSKEKIYDIFCHCFENEMSDTACYKGWIATVLLQNSASSLVIKHTVKDRDGKTVMQYSLWNVKDNPDSVIYFSYNGAYELYVYDSELKEELMKQMENNKEILIKQGYTVIN